MARHERHLAPEVLHAYAAGEVDPARREAYASHLEGCAACRQRLENVRGLHRLMRAAGAPDLDDLSWRRLQMRVRAQLLEDARGGGGLTQDLVNLRTRWGTAALVAAAAVALLVWFAPRRVSPPTDVAPVVAAVIQHVHAREAPVDLTLRSGVELELGALGRMQLRPGADPGATIALEAGTLEVRDLRPPAVSRPIRVEVAPYLVRATHADFVVRRLAAGAAIDVRRGTLSVASGDGPAREVRAGERRVFAPATVASPPPPVPEADAEPRRRPLVVAAPRAVEAEPRPAPSPPVPSTPVSTSEVPPTPPQTKVVVEGPSDPVRAKLLAARRAYYVDGALGQAVALAREVREASVAGPERRGAIELLCQAYTAAEESEHAVEACGALLEGPLDRATRRTLHKQLADIHRTQRGDCAAAIKHYNRVLVFGLSTPLDDAARLWRAECALEVGDTTLAERDLAQLESGSSLKGQDALTRLRERISATKGAQDREGVTDSR